MRAGSDHCPFLAIVGLAALSGDSPRSPEIPSTRVEAESVLERWTGKGRTLRMNIYVGNLPFSSTDGDLEELFGQYGQVDSASVISDRETGRSRGFGFVEMANDDDARRAIEELDGSDVGGRNLRVNEARPRR